tara:strand:+ start:382 stop:825 length:444 start_codon:yes stop_codon:yes gene_type:complete
MEVKQSAETVRSRYGETYVKDQGLDESIYKGKLAYEGGDLTLQREAFEFLDDLYIDFQIEADNGFQNLDQAQKYKFMKDTIQEVVDIFGTENLYSAKRYGRMYDSIAKKIVRIKDKVPLRKDITTYIYKIFSKSLMDSDNTSDKLSN